MTDYSTSPIPHPDTDYEAAHWFHRALEAEGAVSDLQKQAIRIFGARHDLKPDTFHLLNDESLREISGIVDGLVADHPESGYLLAYRHAQSLRRWLATGSADDATVLPFPTGSADT